MSYKVTKIGKTATVRSDMSLLIALTKGANKRIVTRVGILGSGASRVVQEKGESDTAFRKRVKIYQKTGQGADAETNADIGLQHEKGVKSKNLPRRSWLEEPLTDHLGEYFKKLGPKAIQAMLMSNYELAYADLGIIAEQIIQRGFETGGYGKWKELSQQTIRRKGSSAILIDTAQLRRSVTSDVVSK